MSATELTVLEALEQGVAAQGEGRLQDAVNFYLAILEVEPAHAEASHNLGLVMFSVGQVAESLPFLKKAVECSPDKEQFWISYVNALSREGDFEEARQVIADGERAGISFVNYNAATFFQGSSASDVDAGHKTQSPFSKRRSAQTEKKKNRKKLKRRSLQQPADAPQRKELEELVAHYQSDRLDEAKTAALEITRRFPSHPFAWKMLGAVLKALGRSEEALQPTLQSVVLAPFDAEAQSNLGAVLKDVGRYEEALDSLREAVRLAPDSAVAHYNLAGTLQVLEKLGEAVECYQRAIDLKPDYAEAHFFLGRILQDQGALEQADRSYKYAVETRPTYAEAHYNRGIVLEDLGRPEEAVVAFEAAIRAKPLYVEAFNNLGSTLHSLGRLSEAEHWFDTAVTTDPNSAEAWANLGLLRVELGSLDQARAHYERALSIRPSSAELHRQLSTLKKFESDDAQHDALKALYQDQSISMQERCHVNFAMAKAAEDLGHYQQAFQHYREGNELRGRILNYKFDNDAQFFAQIKHAYSAMSDIEFSMTNGRKSPTPIFVLGMPRSGTSLVEQIIAAHSNVAGGGELPFVRALGIDIAAGYSEAIYADMIRFREHYLAALSDKSCGETFITDKMPDNFFFIGLICRALPEAKIVHVKRDPYAVCWANFKQYFQQEGLGYSYSLEDTVEYYKQYAQLMSFWRRTLDDRIYDVDYELLTADPETEIRKLILAIGIDWQDACLSPELNDRRVTTASATQVRQKIYQGSSSHWRQYKPYLDGAFDKLVGTIEPSVEF